MSFQIKSILLDDKDTIFEKNDVVKIKIDCNNSIGDYDTYSYTGRIITYGCESLPLTAKQKKEYKKAGYDPERINSMRSYRAILNLDISTPYNQKEKKIVLEDIAEMIKLQDVAMDENNVKGEQKDDTKRHWWTKGFSNKNFN